MIIRREHYAELSWWKWTKLRGRLFWSRLTGGLPRVLGLSAVRTLPQDLEGASEFKHSCQHCGSHGHIKLSSSGNRDLQ
jgi:hypothetical protein